MMNIALLGPSGAGKGTHAEHLKTNHNLFHICTGDLFRRNVESQSPLGLRAKSCLERGEMVPDEIVDTMIAEHLRTVPIGQGILFDGYPRTPSQANFLEDCFRELGRKLDAVIYLHVSEAEIVHRLSGRVVCHKCQRAFHKTSMPFTTCPTHQCAGEHLYQRADDRAEMARARLRIFCRAVGPLLENYERAGKLILINGQGSVEQVCRELTALIEARPQQEARPSGGLAFEDVRAQWARSAVLRDRALAPGFDLVLIGAPGSGKGTQAEQLAKRFKLAHVATGDLFRENLQEQTPLGQMAKAYMDRGELVPDDITDAMVEERLSRPDTSRGFILDGFPRNVHQAEALAEILAEMDRGLAGVLYIKVPDEQIVGRLAGRLICRNCQSPYHLQFKPPAQTGRCDRCNGPLSQRSDDHPDTVRARLKTFHVQTEPVIAFYAQAGLLIEVDGAQEVAKVAEAAQTAVLELMPPRMREAVPATVAMAVGA